MDIYKNIKLSHIQQGKFHNVWHKKQKEPIIKSTITQNQIRTDKDVRINKGIKTVIVTILHMLKS